MMRRDMSPGDRGRGRSLTLRRARADNARMRLLRRHVRRLRGERGQALVEFALIAPLFLMLVIGIVQFAVALNFWFDLNRLANQGARSAAVNCGEPVGTPQCGTSLANQLGQHVNQGGEIISSGNNPTVEICYIVPSGSDPNSYTAQGGDSVRVTLRDRYPLQLIVNLAKVDLTARATMRLERTPTSTALPAPGSANWCSS